MILLQHINRSHVDLLQRQRELSNTLFKHALPCSLLPEVPVREHKSSFELAETFAQVMVLLLETAVRCFAVVAAVQMVLDFAVGGGWVAYA